MTFLTEVLNFDDDDRDVDDDDHLYNESITLHTNYT